MRLRFGDFGFDAASRQLWVEDIEVHVSNKAFDLLATLIERRPEAVSGDYPIHIIVKGGRIQLLGVVDTEADRTAAELTARGVTGSFGVENNITVHHATT